MTTPALLTTDATAFQTQLTEALTLRLGEDYIPAAEGECAIEHAVPMLAQVLQPADPDEIFEMLTAQPSVFDEIADDLAAPDLFLPAF